MASPSMYQFSLVEVTEALLQQQGITEGRWTVGFEFGFAAIIAGPRPEEARPTALVSVNRVNLVLAEADTPAHMIVDLSPKPAAGQHAPAPKEKPARKSKA